MEGMDQPRMEVYTVCRAGIPRFLKKSLSTPFDLEARFHLYLWMREHVVMRTPSLSTREGFISAHRSVLKPSRAP